MSSLCHMIPKKNQEYIRIINKVRSNLSLDFDSSNKLGTPIDDKKERQVINHFYRKSKIDNPSRIAYTIEANYDLTILPPANTHSQEKSYQSMTNILKGLTDMGYINKEKLPDNLNKGLLIKLDNENKKSVLDITNNKGQKLPTEFRNIENQLIGKIYSVNGNEYISIRPLNISNDKITKTGKTIEYRGEKFRVGKTEDNPRIRVFKESTKEELSFREAEALLMKLSLDTGVSKLINYNGVNYVVNTKTGTIKSLYSKRVNTKTQELEDYEDINYDDFDSDSFELSKKEYNKILNTAKLERTQVPYYYFVENNDFSIDVSSALDFNTMKFKKGTKVLGKDISGQTLEEAFSTLRGETENSLLSKDSPLYQENPDKEFNKNLFHKNVTGVYLDTHSNFPQITYKNDKNKEFILTRNFSKNRWEVQPIENEGNALYLSEEQAEYIAKKILKSGEKNSLYDYVESGEFSRDLENPLSKEWEESYEAVYENLALKKLDEVYNIKQFSSDGITAISDNFEETIETANKESRRELYHNRHIYKEGYLPLMRELRNQYKEKFDKLIDNYNGEKLYDSNSKEALVINKQRAIADIITEEKYEEGVSFNNNKKTNNTNPSSQPHYAAQQETISKLNDLIKDFSSKVKRSIDFTKTHEYLERVTSNKWKKVDSSVTQLIKEDEENSEEINPQYGIPASRVGTAVDDYIRIYFETLKENPNLDRNNLEEKVKNKAKEEIWLFKERDEHISSLNNIIHEFLQKVEDKHGKDAIIITQEFPLLGMYNVKEKNGKTSMKTVAGTVDMLIVDKEGKLFIYDMKTMRSEKYFNSEDFGTSKRIKYSKQLNAYKQMIEQTRFGLKVEGVNLFPIKVDYPKPSKYNIYSAEEGKQEFKINENNANEVEDIKIERFADSVYNELNKEGTKTPLTKDLPKNLTVKTINDTNKKANISTEVYQKDDPIKNPNTGYIFTENAQAYIYSKGLEEEGITEDESILTGKDNVKLNVSTSFKNPNQAGVRAYKDENGKTKINSNAYGLIVKRSQQNKSGKFIMEEGYLRDNKEEDFMLFTKLNNMMFDDILSNDNIDNIVLPSSIASGRAKLPSIKYANWLKDNLLKRFNIEYEIVVGENSEYSLIAVGENKPIIKDKNVDLSGIIEESAKKDTNDSIETENPNKEMQESITEIQNNMLFTASEKKFIGDSIMYLTSWIISELSKNKTFAKEFYKVINPNFKEEDLDGTDYTRGLDRKDIIRAVTIPNIFQYIKEVNFKNPRNINKSLTIRERGILKQKYQFIYDNFDNFAKLSYSKLISLEGISVVESKPEYITEEQITEESENTIYEEEEKEAWQKSIKNISPTTSLSTKIKRAITRIMRKDENGNPILDKYGYGLNTYLDDTKVVNTIFNWTKDCLSIEDMEEVLKEKALIHNWVQDILDIIKEEPFRSEFFTNFRKDHINYSNITISNEEGTESYKSNLINRSTVVESHMKNVKTAYSQGKVKISKNPEVIRKSIDKIRLIKNSIKKELELNLKDQNGNSRSKEEVILYNRQVIKNNINTLQNLLSALGVEIDEIDLIDSLSYDSVKRNSNNYSIIKVLDECHSILSTIDNQLTKGVKIEDYFSRNKNKDGHINLYNNYNAILQYISQSQAGNIESCVFENGKMYYSYNTPSFLGKLMSKLKGKTTERKENKEKAYETLMQDLYGKYKWFSNKAGSYWSKHMWISELINNPKSRNNLDHKVQLNFDKTGYTELSPVSYAKSIFFEYVLSKGDYAWFRVPILANKPSSEFIKFKRHSGADYKETLLDGFYGVFMQELDRMVTVLNRVGKSPIGSKDKASFDIDPKLLKNNKDLRTRIEKGELTKEDLLLLKNSGCSFKFLHTLNNVIQEDDTFAQSILDILNGESSAVILSKKEFNTIFEKEMDKIVESEYNSYKELGMFDTEEVENVGKEYIHLKGIEGLEGANDTSLKNLKSLVEEFVWNDMFAAINIIELTSTDLAYFRNVEDFQKRNSQIHSPGLKMNTTAVDNNGNRYSKDGICRTVYLKDVEVKSEQLIDDLNEAFNKKIDSLTDIKEKENMRKMKDLILSSYEKVNWADAQAYSSITSYRKKMGMLGRWSPKMDEAFARIKDGNYNIDDLGIVWQPLKPFVYSHTTKTMDNNGEVISMKVPVQNKNSEYLLLVAGALLYNENNKSENNILKAIMDFMEETAKDGMGIDTVQFESAVNVGSMGAIEISPNDSYEDVLGKLRSNVYKKGNNGYNQDHVHEYSFEDYSIQQEVPAHLQQENGQMLGSQMKVLAVSDIKADDIFNINGEEMNGKDLIDKYQKLLSENVENSIEELRKDLGLDNDNPIVSNIKMSNILLEAIQKDARYGSDLMKACSLDKGGNFNIPLADPIQSVRIQQLINSIIKSRVNKQRIPGGPVVQTSSFGLSRDLKCVVEDGRLKYAECYLPVPNSELEEALFKGDKVLSVEEAIERGIIEKDSDILKAIGYRIPTEDKYSMLPLKIVGFMPKAAGEVIMLPKEITTIAGSDFDIDKMYIELKTVPLNNYSKINLKDRGKNLKELTLKLIQQAVTTNQSKVLNTLSKNPIIKEYIESLNNKEYNEKVERKVLNELIQQARNYNEGINVDKSFNAIFEIFKGSKSIVNKVFKAKELSKREKNNNDIFDIQWSVLTSSLTLDKIFNPGSFDQQKKTSRIIQVAKLMASNKEVKKEVKDYKDLESKSIKELDEIIDKYSTTRNIVLGSTQVYFHKQNMTAGKLIGICANHNISHAIVGMFNEKQSISNNKIAIKNDDYDFKIDGKTINGTILDAMKGNDDSYISKVIAGFLAASVDAVKDQVLNHMNLNTVTANIALVLARLGYDSNLIGLFLTQPILLKVTEEYIKRNDLGYASLDSIIDEYLEIKTIEDEEALMKNLKGTTNINKEGLYSNINNSITDEYQKTILMAFKKLNEAAQEINDLTFITKFNSVSNAAGPSIADNIIMQRRVSNFMSKVSSDKENSSVLNTAASNILKESPLINSLYSVIDDGTGNSGKKGVAKEIFEKYFPHYNKDVSNILDTIENSTTMRITDKLINNLVSDYMLFHMTSSNPGSMEENLIKGDESQRNYYLNTFVKQFLTIKRSIKDNALLDLLYVEEPTKKCPYPTINIKTTALSIDAQDEIKNAWEELLNNPATHTLGINLFKYGLYRFGFNFSPKGYSHLSSVAVKQGIQGYIKGVEDILEGNEIESWDFIYQFLRNNSTDRTLVPVINNEDFKVDENELKTYRKLTINLKESKKKTKIARGSGENTKFCPIINYKGMIFKVDNISSNDGIAVYEQTTPLGIPNNFKEYNSAAGDINTVVNKKTIRENTTKDSQMYNRELYSQVKDIISSKMLSDIFERNNKFDKTEGEIRDNLVKNISKAVTSIVERNNGKIEDKDSLNIASDILKEIENVC